MYIMEIINRAVIETVEYYVNYTISQATTYSRQDNYFNSIYIIRRCIFELELNNPYIEKGHITTKHNFLYYLEHIKKIKLDELREKLTDKDVDDMMKYCERVSFIKDYINESISFIHLLEYYYVTSLYFYKHILVKCLKKYIQELNQFYDKTE